MCRPGGRRCPSSSVARPSRSKEARAIRAAAPRVASSLAVALSDQQTTDPAYIARSGTSQVFVKAVPFEYLPSVPPKRRHSSWGSMRGRCPSSRASGCVPQR